METKTGAAETHRNDFLVKHQVHFEVAPYFILLDERPEGGKPHTKRIQAGYDIDLYAEGSDHKELPAATNDEVHEIENDLVAACNEIAKDLPTSHIEIIPFQSTLILDVNRHLEPRRWCASASLTFAASISRWGRTKPRHWRKSAGCWFRWVPGKSSPWKNRSLAVERQVAARNGGVGVSERFVGEVVHGGLKK